MAFKVGIISAATTAAFIISSYAIADSNSGGVTPESGKLISKINNIDLAATKAQPAKPQGIDFLNSDAPFKIEGKIGDHNADIQFYGIVDIGGASVNHSLHPNQSLPNSINPYSYDAAGGSSKLAHSQQVWIQGGLQDSRFGLKGGVDLFKFADHNLRFIYQLEAGFNPLTGELNDAAKSLSDASFNNKKTTYGDSSLNGNLFARQAWAGVDGGKLGKITYGIQYNPFYDITGAYDPNRKADSFSPLGESGAIGGGGGVSENARMKNSLKYTNSFDAPMAGKVNVTGMYQFGNDVNTDSGRGYAAQVGYENELFGIQTAYNNFEDTVKVDATTQAQALAGTPLKAGLYNTQAWILAAKITPNKEVKFSGGYQWIQLNQPSDTPISYGHIFSNRILGGVASNLNNSSKSITGGSNGGDHQNIDFWWLGGEYDFAKRFPVLTGLTLSGAYYYTKFDPLSGISPKGIAGVPGKDFHIGTETVILDYKINKRFDVYGAATWNQFRGTFVKTMTYSNINAYGVGVRLKF